MVSEDSPNGSNFYKFDKERRELYLDGIRRGLRVCEAAKAAGIHRDTVYKYKQKHPEFQEEEDRAESDSLEVIENKLYMMAEAGNMRAIEMILYSRSPGRYSRREQLEAKVKHDGSLKVVLEVVDGREEEAQN